MTLLLHMVYHSKQLIKAPTFAGLQVVVSWQPRGPRAIRRASHVSEFIIDVENVGPRVTLCVTLIP